MYLEVPESCIFEFTVVMLCVLAKFSFASFPPGQLCSALGALSQQKLNT